MIDLNGRRGLTLTIECNHGKRFLYFCSFLTTIDSSSPTECRGSMMKTAAELSCRTRSTNELTPPLGHFIISERHNAHLVSFCGLGRLLQWQLLQFQRENRCQENVTWYSSIQIGPFLLSLVSSGTTIGTIGSMITRLDGCNWTRRSAIPTIAKVETGSLVLH